MSRNPEEDRQLDLAELPRPEPSGGTYRESGAALQHRRRGLVIDLLGISILFALLLVGALAVVSAQGIGEEGLGVAMMCGSVLLLVKEVLYSLHLRNAPVSPAPTPPAPPTGESHD